MFHCSICHNLFSHSLVHGYLTFTFGPVTNAAVNVLHICVPSCLYHFLRGVYWEVDVCIINLDK